MPIRFRLAESQRIAVYSTVSTPRDLPQLWNATALSGKMDKEDLGAMPMPETADESRPVAVTRFDRRSGALKREGVFRSLPDAAGHVQAVADVAGLLLRESVQVNRDGLGSVSLFDSAGQPAIEFHLVNQVSNEYGPTEGVAVFSVSTGDDGRVERVTACGVYGSHTEILEAEEFAWSFIKGSEGMRYVGLTIPFSLGIKSRFESVEKAG